MPKKSKQNRKKLKPFEMVRIGDEAIDYTGERFKVHDKGNAQDMFKKYPNQPYNLTDFLNDMEISSNDAADVDVIVGKPDKSETLSLEGYTYFTFNYGYDGAWVEEEGEINWELFSSIEQNFLDVPEMTRKYLVSLEDTLEKVLGDIRNKLQNREYKWSVKDVYDEICKVNLHSEKRIGEFLETYTTGNYVYEMETSGDLEDLIKIMDLGGEELIFANLVLEFLMTASVICSPDDLREIPRLRSFEEKYPKLFRTFKVWAWG